MKRVLVVVVAIMIILSILTMLMSVPLMAPSPVRPPTPHGLGPAPGAVDALHQDRLVEFPLVSSPARPRYVPMALA